MRIEIIGSIASGKTTLAGALASDALHMVAEDLTTNQYLQQAQDNPEHFGLLCQKKFLTDKIGQMGWEITFLRNVVSDYSIITEKAYARHHLGVDSPELPELDERVDRFYTYYGQPDLFIYLTVPFEEQLERIKSRGREFEQKIDEAYLRKLGLLIEDQVRQLEESGIKVLKLDSTNPQRDLVAEIYSAFEMA